VSTLACDFEGTRKKSLAAYRSECHLLAIVMRKAMTIFSFRGQDSRRASAVLGLALFLALQLVTSSETLHKLIHSDANKVKHQCAATLFAHGQVNAAESFAPLVAFVAALFFFLPLLQAAALPSFDYRYSTSRAPPLR
jgi:hypothetical protein